MGKRRQALGFGRSPTGSGPAGAAARKSFYKARERRQKTTLAAGAAVAGVGIGRALHRRRKASKARRDSKGRFT